jgi:hypothetical protein
MIRDTLRAALAVAVMAVAAALLVEVRWQLAAIDLAHRAAVLGPGLAAVYHAPPPAPEPAPLRRLGRATLDLADAALGVVR